MILANTAYTLADWTSATDDAGNIVPMVNLLSQENEILLDIPWMECNQVMSHKTTVVTGLPAPTGACTTWACRAPRPRGCPSCTPAPCWRATASSTATWRT